MFAWLQKVSQWCCKTACGSCYCGKYATVPVWDCTSCVSL